MPEHQRRKVLIVEDEPFIADIQKLLLERKGYTCRTAGDYGSAVEAHKEMEPDIVLLDLNMDGRNGLEILEEMNKTGGSDIYIVTGVNDSKVADRCISLGARGYLLKPFRSKELIRMIEREN